jgi:hypothetical protein
MFSNLKFEQETMGLIPVTYSNNIYKDEMFGLLKNNENQTRRLRFSNLPERPGQAGIPEFRRTGLEMLLKNVLKLVTSLKPMKPGGQGQRRMFSSPSIMCKAS